MQDTSDKLKIKIINKLLKVQKNLLRVVNVINKYLPISECKK